MAAAWQGKASRDAEILMSRRAAVCMGRCERRERSRRWMCMLCGSSKSFVTVSEAPALMCNGAHVLQTMLTIVNGSTELGVHGDAGSWACGCLQCSDHIVYTASAALVYNIA